MPTDFIVVISAISLFRASLYRATYCTVLLYDTCTHVSIIGVQYCSECARMLVAKHARRLQVQHGNLLPSLNDVLLKYRVTEIMSFCSSIKCTYYCTVPATAVLYCVLYLYIASYWSCFDEDGVCHRMYHQRGINRSKHKQPKSVHATNNQLPSSTPS